jgi:hypothetical protein
VLKLKFKPSGVGHDTPRTGVVALKEGSEPAKSA